MSSLTPARIVRELPDAELLILSTMLRKRLFAIDADQVVIDLETGRFQSWSLVMFPTQALDSLVAMTAHWYQTPVDNYHVFEIGKTLPSTGFTVVDGDDGNWSIHSGGRFQLASRGRVLSIDVVSYEHETYWAESGELAESLKYDRALVFEFDQGDPLTLTTEHGSILGAFEIRSGVKPGFDYDEGTFSTRVTLN